MVSIDTSNFSLKNNIVMELWADALKQDMLTRVPKEYGTMAASIETKVLKPFDSKTGGSIEVGTNTNEDYPEFVEWGTGPMREAHGSHITGSPVTNWEALRQRGEVGSGQTMPFARTANFFTKRNRKRILKEAFH